VMHAAAANGIGYFLLRGKPENEISNQHLMFAPKGSISRAPMCRTLIRQASLAVKSVNLRKGTDLGPPWGLHTSVADGRES
jgi:hypothetical protein